MKDSASNRSASENRLNENLQIRYNRPNSNKNEIEEKDLQNNSRHDELTAKFPSDENSANNSQKFNVKRNINSFAGFGQSYKSINLKKESDKAKSVYSGDSHNSLEEQKQVDSEQNINKTQEVKIKGD